MPENACAKVQQGITERNRQMKRPYGFFDNFGRGSVSAVADQGFTEDGRERTDAIMTEAEPIDTPDKIRDFSGKRFAA